jgi:LPXTG-motif cell wall-anchored protein
LLIAQTKLADTGSSTSGLGATALGAAALLALGIALATDRRRRIGRTGR